MQTLQPRQLRKRFILHNLAVARSQNPENIHQRLSVQKRHKRLLSFIPASVGLATAFRGCCSFTAQGRETAWFRPTVCVSSAALVFPSSMRRYPVAVRRFYCAFPFCCRRRRAGTQQRCLDFPASDSCEVARARHPEIFRVTSQK